MASPPIIISLLSLFSLILLVHAGLNLHRPDLDAFLGIQNDLVSSVNGQPHSPCNSAAGVFCERRVFNGSHVLRITRLVFKSQMLSGFLSPGIGILSELKELSLPNNLLVDQIPAQIVDCRKLEILNLTGNQFSGKVPTQLFSLVRLRILDLSSNKFSGNLNFLKHFPNLEILSLANNLFTGKVPVSLRSFRNLRFLDISGNNLVEGPVPLNEFQTSQLNLQRENRVPKRYVFAETNRTSSRNNTTAMAPSQAPSPSATPPHKHDKKKKKAWKYIVGFLVGAVAGTLSGAVFSVLFKLILILIKGKKASGMVIYSSLIKNAEDLAFLEKEDGLASLELIGKGGCGEVYKSELPNGNGKWIAIKKVVQPPRDASELTDEDTKLLNKKMRQIRSEIQTVGHIRHRNLLPLLAYVPRRDCHYLVYEFMKNGSLQDMLNKELGLDWLTRHKIAVGIAAGLEYLHIDHNPKIIHRDLKPANILLDDQLDARIADFGLAMAMPDAHTHVTASNVAGTVGYIAPEYHQTLKFTDKCDIYSFGVILGVLVLGKMPSDEFFQHTAEVSLVRWMRNMMTAGDGKKAIDPRLIGNGYEEQMLLVLKIACFCTLDDPKERPNSKDVGRMLAQIKL